MPNTYDFTTPSGKTVDRELLIAFINTGTEATPVWSVLGTRVEDSSNTYDWQSETIKDILGKTWTTLRKPTVTQSFDPYPLDAGDTGLTYIWKLAVVDQDAASLAAQDMLIVHAYAGFGERYKGCAIEYNTNGGTGGGNVAAGINVTYGGDRIIGTASYTNGTVTFTPET